MALNSIDKVTDRFDRIGNAGGQLQSRVEDAGNRVQNTVDGAARGVESATNLYNNVYDKAGETWNKVSEGASSLSSGLSKLFGSDDLATTEGVKAAGSGESGASPATRIEGFSNKPQETLPTLDPIKRDVQEPFKPKNEAASGVLDYLQPGKAGNLLSQGFTKLKDLRDSAFKAIGTDYASVKKRLENTMQIAGQLARLPGEIQSEIQGYASMINQTRSEITAVIDGAKYNFESLKDFDNYLAIDDLISSFTGNSGSIAHLDIGTSSALIYGLSGKLSEMGIAGRTDAMVEAIKDPVAKAALYGELLIQAANLGNLDSVDHYMAKLQPGQGRELAPTVIQAILSNLQVENGVGYKQYGDRLLTLFTALDPNWDKTKVAPITVELLPYTYCNANAIQSLITTAKRAYVCAAGSRRLQTSSTLVDQFYPI